MGREGRMRAWQSSVVEWSPMFYSMLRLEMLLNEMLEL